jgi:hypothetical protein
MNTFLSILKITLAIVGGWFAVILWLLLLTVKKSPLNLLMENIGIVPLMTHSNVGGIIDLYHFSILVQSVLVFSSGGFLAAYIAKDHELIASSILSVFVVFTCIIWNSYVDCRVYRAVDLFIWFDGFLIIMLSGFIVERKRLMKYFLHSITRRSN